MYRWPPLFLLLFLICLFLLGGVHDVVLLFLQILSFDLWPFGAADVARQVRFHVW